MINFNVTSMRSIKLFLIFAVIFPQLLFGQAANDTIDIKNLAVHDPDILADTVTQTYYLYGSYSPQRPWERIKSANGNAGVQVYWSKDLKHWGGPKIVFEEPDYFWASTKSGPWAPEVHYYNGKYYLFVTFTNWQKLIKKDSSLPPNNERGSQILFSDSPLGSFKPFYNHPTLPDTMMTLDATFWIENGRPWIVYSHEWVQISNGRMEAMRLTKNLSGTIGKPVILFSAGDAGWTEKILDFNGKKYPGSVTDGPYLYRTKESKLLMIWSSWSKKNSYSLALAYSESGKLKGPWRLTKEPIMTGDRGHGMIFKGFDGRLLLVLHKYFQMPKTRVQIYELKDTGKTIRVLKQIFGAQ